MQTATARPTPALLSSLPRPSGRQTAIASLLVGAACFGLGTVASKGALDGFAPLTLAAARFAIAAVVLTVLCRARGIAPVYDGRAVLLGLTGIALPFGFQNLGLTETSAGSALLLVEGGVPLMTAVLGLLLLRERIGGACLCGLVLGVGGVAAVAVEELGGGTPVGGAALSLASAAAFAVYTVLGRRIFRGGFSLEVLAGGTTLGTLMLVPLAGVEVRASGLPSPDLGEIGLLLFLGLIGSAATQVLWAHGMAHLDAAEVGVFGTFIPIVGIAAAALLLGEPVSSAQLLGAALIAGGMVVTVRTAPLRRPRILRRRQPRPLETIRAAAHGDLSSRWVA